jgi:uroporphyrinogen decarboxylase
MTPRENILGLFRKTGYETAPVCFDLCPLKDEEFRKKTGSDKSYRDYYNFPWKSTAAPERKWETPDWRKYHGPDLKEGTTFDLYGVGWEPGGYAHLRGMRNPMKNFTSVQQMMDYPFPDWTKSDFGPVKKSVEEIHRAGHAAMFSFACSIWETSWYIRGMEELMMDMMSGDPMASFLLDKVTDNACYIVKKAAEAGIDFLHTGDDIGMQKSIMMSESMHREWIKPRMVKVIKTAKDANPDLIVSYHSCGYVKPFIKDLIEIGVDTLNPVQPECMSFEEIFKEFGDRLSFWGTIGTQTTLPFGKPEDVRREVLKNLELAGGKGGLLCAPTHLIEPEVPWENIEAYIKACGDFKP